MVKNMSQKWARENLNNLQNTFFCLSSVWLSNTFRHLERAADDADSNEPNKSSVRPILTELQTFPRLYRDLLRTLYRGLALSWLAPISAPGGKMTY
jgi:hypothetical protein